MKPLSILIVDDTIIGQALSECLAHFASAISDRQNINIQIISNKNVKEIANTSDKVLEFLRTTPNNPSLIFINLMLKILEQYRDNTMPGLNIAQEISLANLKQNAIILLYSFDREPSLRRYGGLNDFISLPGHIYFSLPINIEGHLKSWMELAEALSFSGSQEEIRKVFSDRARQVSAQYLKDFKHSIIDKVLPKMLANLREGQDLKFYFLLRSRIQTLFSVEVSELCGIDMPNVFSPEWRRIQQCLKTMGQAGSSTRDILFAETKKLERTLSSVVDRAMRFSGRWEFTFIYCDELKQLCGCTEKLGEFLKAVWDVELCELVDERYVDIWRILRPKISEYYEWRAQLERSLWRLSIWVMGKRSRMEILKFLKEVLDPLMERIEEGDYRGASTIFNQDILESIGIKTSTCLSNIFINDVGGAHD